MLRLQFVAWLWALALAQCSSEAPAAAADASPTGSADPRELKWLDHGEFALDAAGATAPVAVAVEGTPRAVLLRATLAAGMASEHACFGFEQDAGSGAASPSWVALADCASCAVATVTHGYAQALWLPAELPAAGLYVRVVMRECQTGVPLAPGALGSSASAVRVESLQPSPLAQPVGRLEVAVAYPAGASAQDRAGWGAPLKLAWQALAGAGITVEMAPSLTLPAGLAVAPLELGPANHEGAVALQQAVDKELVQRWSAQWQRPASDPLVAARAARTLVVAALPCLRWDDPAAGGTAALLGHSARLPGGPRVAGFASLVVVGTASCKPPTADQVVQLGNVVAHEVGHFLGLRHTATWPGDLMQVDVASFVGKSLAFSAEQAARLRRHPLVN